MSTKGLAHQNFEKIDRSLIDLTISNQGDIKALWTNLSAIWDDLANKFSFFSPRIYQNQ